MVFDLVEENPKMYAPREAVSHHRSHQNVRNGHNNHHGVIIKMVRKQHYGFIKDVETEEEIYFKFSDIVEPREHVQSYATGHTVTYTEKHDERWGDARG